MPSLELDPGDTDFRHLKTASIVNLISALRELREHLGGKPVFRPSEANTPQIPAGIHAELVSAEARILIEVQKL
jgi:chitinase